MKDQRISWTDMQTGNKDKADVPAVILRSVVIILSITIVGACFGQAIVHVLKRFFGV